MIYIRAWELYVYTLEIQKFWKFKDNFLYTRQTRSLRAAQRLTF